MQSKENCIETNIKTSNKNNHSVKNVYILHTDFKAAAIVNEYIEDTERKVIEIEAVNPKKSSDKIIQAALSSNNNNDLKVILKPGEYIIKHLIKVFDNTELIAEGTTITQKKKGNNIS